MTSTISAAARGDDRLRRRPRGFAGGLTRAAARRAWLRACDALADCVATAERDDGRDGREYEHADRGDDLEHDDHSDDRHDHEKNCLHGSDYMTLKLSGSREFALRA
jgi:hypothetical protein